MLVITLSFRFIGAEVHLHYVGSIAAGTACAAFVKIRAHYLRHTLKEVEAYQAHDFWQKHRIRNSLQVIMHTLEECDHIGDPAHQACRAVARKELTAMQAALGNSPSPDIIRGNKPPTAVGAVEPHWEGGLVK